MRAALTAATLPPLARNSIRLYSRRGVRCASTKQEFASESDAKPPPSLPTHPSTRYTQPIYAFPEPTSDEASTLSEDTLKVLSLSSKYILPVYARPPFVLSHGKGMYVYTSSAPPQKLLDFSAGIAVNSLGHADDGVAQVLKEQAERLVHASNVYHNKWASRLAGLIVELTRREGGLGWEIAHAGAVSEVGASDQIGEEEGRGAKVFFANSGAEANEGALKVARAVGKTRGENKTRIVCFEHAFHGRTLGALSITPNPKYQGPFTPLLPNVDVGTLNDMSSLDSLVNDETCAVVVEPIQGEGGVNVARTEWLTKLRERCDQVGAVLIYDEIQSGLYRTGTLWAHSALPVECHPDIVTMAKPLANGYPIGAVLMRDSVAQVMTPGTHGTTFGGSPLACAVGHHVLSRLSARPFAAHVAETSAYLRARLELLPGWFPEVLQPEIRGRGFILGLGFNDASAPSKVVEMARERGVLLLTAGKDAVRLVPSLTVGQAEVDVAMDVLESCVGQL